ncbi:hypothetical protein HAX54_022626, partial [Datura stramonium]|nr:hypothetical protein [Datura stramonium]
MTHHVLVAESNHPGEYAKFPPEPMSQVTTRDFLKWVWYRVIVWKFGEGAKNAPHPRVIGRLMCGENLACQVLEVENLTNTLVKWMVWRAERLEFPERIQATVGEMGGADAPGPIRANFPSLK